MDNELLLVMSNFSNKETKCNLLEKYKDYGCEVLLNNYDSLSNILKPYQSVLLKLTKK